MKPFIKDAPIYDANIKNLAISRHVKSGMLAGRVLASLLVTLSRTTYQILVEKRLAFDAVDSVLEVVAKKSSSRGSFVKLVKC